MNARHFLRIIFFSVWFVGAISVQADANAFNEANRLFEQGKFPQAINGYEKLLQSGTGSVPVYFNLGNAYLKSGQMGRAIVAYRKAAQLSPRDPDVRENLRFARAEVGGGAKSSRNLGRSVVTRLTLNEWSVLTGVIVSAWFLLLAARQWKTSWKNSFRGLLVIFGVAGLGTISCLIAAVRYQADQPSVVIVPEAVVRRGPFDEAPSVFTLRDGSEVSVLSRKDEWVEVAASSEKTGWMLGKQLLGLNPVVLSAK